ncbi:MAG: PBS lyase, partial [Methanomicrobiales archaeon]|nr:PBS lyase [Methanomicrobiales archaeon]
EEPPPAIIVEGEPEPAVEDRPTEMLIDDLGSDDAGVRERAADTIVERGSEAVAPLIAALSLAEGRRRWYVAEILTALGDEAIPALITALGDETAQAGAAATLVRIGRPAVPPLIEMLAGGDGEIQFGSRYALQEIGDEAIPFLVEALDAPDGATRRSAAEILGNLRWRAPDDAGSIRLLIAGEAWLDVAGYGAAAIDPLIRTLRTRDRETRWNAARTLGEIGEPAIEPLIDLLHEADDEIGPLTVMALGEIGEPAVAPLIGLLSDPALRDTATEALAKIGEPAVEGCIQALDHADADTLESVSMILTAIGEPAIPALIQALTGRSALRGHAADILEGMGWEPWSDTEHAWYLIAREQWMELALMGAPAVGPLIKTLGGDDDRIKSEAAGTLGEIGDPAAVGSLVGALADEGIAPAAAEALIAIGEAAVAPVLGLLEEGGAARESAVEVLGRLGAHEAVPAIVDLVRSGGDRLHRKAVDALISIGAPAIDSLIPLLGEEEDGHAGAVAALTGIGDDARESLVAVIGDRSARTRMGAAMVLERLDWTPAGVEEEAAYLVALQRWPDAAGLGGPAAEPLAALLGDLDEGVQAGAAEALLRIGPPAVPPLIRLLGEEGGRVAAGDTLVQIGDAAVEPLIHALDDSEISRAAAGVLARIGEPAAATLIPALGRPGSGDIAAEILTDMGEASIKPLLEALGSDDARVRRRGGDLLIDMGDAAIGPLISALNHPDDDLRLGAIETLVRAGEPVIPALVEALLNEHYRVRLGAAEVLGRVGWKPETEREMISYLIAKEQWTSAAELGPGAVESLVRALGDPDSTIQMGAARALGMIGEPAVAELIKALRDEREGGQRKAVEALKLVGEPAIGPLIDALQDRDWHIRLGAARALISIGDPAVEPLIRSLRSGPPTVQMGVAAVLGKTGNPAAIDPLTDTLLHGDWRVGRVVVRALGMMGEAAVKPLLRVIREGDDPARKSAGAALVLIGDEAVRLLPDALTDRHFRVRAGAADALDRLGWSPEPGEEEVCYLIAKEQWSDLITRGAIAVGPLVQVLDDRDDSIRRRAAKILGELRDPRAIEPLMALLHDDFYSIRREAAAALVTMGAPAMEPVMAALGDEDDDVRKRAADILAEIGDLRAVGPLERVFGDEDWYVRRAAMEAAKRIRERDQPALP